MTKNWTGERWETLVNNETALEHLHRYALACKFSTGKTVLDIACGEGYGSHLLAQQAASVTGVDSDELTITKAKDKYQAANLRFVIANALATSLPEKSFDLVVSFETLEHLQEHEQLMQEFKRLLKPDGLLLISTPDKAQYSDKRGYRNPFHKKEVYKSVFEALLRKQFSHVQLLSQTVCHSSLISSGAESGLDIYAGNHEKLEKYNADNGLYLIGFAAEVALPPLNNSLFIGNSVLQAALEEQERDFRNTLTYRLGHFLLFPFKWIKKRFNL